MPCDNSCSSCSVSSANCTSCDSPSVLTSSQVCAPSCPDGFYNKSGVCAQCHSSCTTCDGGSVGNCLTCSGNLFESNKACVKTCTSGFFGNSDTHTCVACDSSCATCTGASSSTCSTCNDGSLFTRTHDTTTGTCKQTCDAGYYASIDNTTCLGEQISSHTDALIIISLECDVSCQTCDGSASSDCLTCKEPLHYHSTAKTCTDTCDPGAYLENETCQRNRSS